MFEIDNGDTLNDVVTKMLDFMEEHMSELDNYSKQRIEELSNDINRVW